MAPKKRIVSLPENVGAPANAAKLDQHAKDSEEEVMRVKAEIASLVASLPQLDGDPERTRHANDQIQARRKDLNDAYDLWFKLSKQALDHDQKVALDRREGEKIARSEAEEFFKQFRLSIKLAIEKYIISLSQDATRAESPEQFYQAHADNIRTAMTSEIENAQKDGKLPKWALIE